MDNCRPDECEFAAIPVTGVAAYDLDRFVQAQEPDYARALSELRAGEKRSHWMWYVFPQLEGLGHSAMSRRYSIKNAAEAKAYLDHPLLGARLRECFAVLQQLTGRSAHQIFGSPDDLKLRSCATLFASVSGEKIFSEIIDKYFDGERDDNTIQLLRRESTP